MRVVTMTLEEAMAISEHRLPGEPPEADWRTSRPRREPARRERGIDTAPAPDPIDWALVIRGAIKAERSIMSEVIGSAMGEYVNQQADELLAEVRQLIASAVEELRAEFTRQLDQLREDFTAQATELFESVALISTESQRLRSQMDAINLKKARARARSKANGNGSADALPLADASLAQHHEHGPQ
jgi:hypothetical protein